MPGQLPTIYDFYIFCLLYMNSSVGFAFISHTHKWMRLKQVPCVYRLLVFLTILH